jgi:putative DNA primase/helicase
MTVNLIELTHDQRQRRRFRRHGALENSEPRVELIAGCDIAPEPINWLWPGWLASGKLHVLAGPPGTGKTTVAAALAGTITSGGEWPDQSASPQGNVLIWSGEDEPADTLVPRLMAAGADLKAVFFVDKTHEQGVERSFDPATDMQPLLAAVRAIGGIRLLIIDPIVSVVQGDSHKNAEVRRGLQPLVTLASEMGCAILGVTHFSKGTGGKDPVERISGSIAFGALARIVFVTAKLPDDEMGSGVRIFCRSKSNIGPDEGGFRYELRQVELDSHPDIKASRVQWGDPVSGSARELLARAEETQTHAQIRGDMPQDVWLFDYLTHQAQSATQCMEEALAAGFTKKQIRDARERLRVTSTKRGYAGGWYWSLPEGTFQKP